MTLMVGLHHFFLEMSKKCWPRFRVRNSTCDKQNNSFPNLSYDFSLRNFYCDHDKVVQKRATVNKNL
jgi:hypothetical protein